MRIPLARLLTAAIVAACSRLEDPATPPPTAPLLAERGGHHGDGHYEATTLYVWASDQAGVAPTSSP